MGKYFTFVDRTLPIEFFADDPVTVTLQLGDETDKRLLTMGKQLDASATFEDAKAALAEIVLIVLAVKFDNSLIPCSNGINLRIGQLSL